MKNNYLLLKIHYKKIFNLMDKLNKKLYPKKIIQFIY